MAQSNNVVMENVRIEYRNFAGKEGEFNREGDRNFAIFLRPEEAEAMIDDGWNVKFTKVREEGDEPQPYIQVSVSYKNRPPRIVMITSRGRTDLPEEMVSLLDYADIKNVDLILNPYHWNVGAKSGIKAYLKSLYMVIDEDPLELKYGDLPQAGLNAPSKELEAYEVIEGEIIDASESRQIGR